MYRYCVLVSIRENMANGNSEGNFFPHWSQPNLDAKNLHINKIFKKARSGYHFRRKWKTQTRVCVCVGGVELELN